MTAFTSKASGNWSASGQTTWNEVGVPGDGDTVTISHNVTVTASITIGSSPSSAGTPAIQFGSSAKTLAVADGVSVVCKGDVRFDSDASGGINTLQIGAGCDWKFLPPSGQQYGWRAASGGDAGGALVVNGTSGSRTTLWVDKSLGGLSGYHTTVDFHPFKFVASYTDFIDFGTATRYGFISQSRSATTTLSVTNCTFTRCSEQHIGNGNMSVDATYRDNTHSGSVLRTDIGTTHSILFSYSASATGAAVISYNSFDARIRFADFTSKTQFVGNVASNLAIDGTSSWTSSDSFLNNLLYGISGLTLYGPHKGNYYLNSSEIDNPHYISHSGANTTEVKDNVFEAVALSGTQADAGDCLVFDSTAVAVAITGNLTLPSNLPSVYSGVLVTIHTGNGPYSIAHNTASNLIADYSHGGNLSAGAIAILKSNLVYSGAKIRDTDHTTSGGTQDVVSPTNADYNGSYNVDVTTSPLPPGGYVNSGNGYIGNFSAVPGSNDISLASDPFFDRTRGIATWAQSKGQDSTFAAGRDLLLASPRLLTEDNTGLYDWVRAGFAVTAAALKDAGHDSVTIGAMGYVAPASTGRTGMNHRTLRPY